MNMGHITGQVKATIIALAAAAMAFFAPAALAQEEAPAAQVAEEAVESASVAGYVPMAPTIDKGMPTDPRADTPGAMMKSLTFQDQYTETGAYALGMHDYLLMPVITVISLFVLGLLLYVVVRFSRRANPEPSKTTHNTAIEVIWTIVPVLILVVIAVPSITLLAAQYETPPEEAITVKAIGAQWYWEYEYPDHGVSFTSKMLNEPGQPVVNPGVREVGSEPWDGPGQMEVDNRMVVPAGVPLRIQTTAGNVIHAFAVPSLWFKMDAIPGRLNEKLLTIEEPGVYYGQCSELCGVNHAYMPIAVEALPLEEFNAWVLEQGGTIPGADVAEAGVEGEGEAAPTQVALAN
jgi:cytochrome c oxidase subunit 2